ncbi:hypothetical protein [Gallaecimonas xiamenensis]|uniref:Flagellar protein FlgP n=1 Tax=Gallaecimonas xiamenensis 3-C-1 TaxID=745411 RepID=K2IYA9_9GAMM|nr:hypothetical protein [Gallaecimonas xiamenensis]EKE75461.1 hypothetical protein B3C1_07284 [Gallaecimonas xiamenensis 3-C-1]
MRYLLLTLAGLLSACSNHPWTVKHEVLNAVGIAIVAEQPGKTEAERQRQAMEASKVLAYKELAEQLYGVSLTTYGRVEQGRLRMDEGELRTEGVVRGAEVLRSYQLDGRYITEVRLDTERMANLQETQLAPAGMAMPGTKVVRGF